MNVRTPGTTRPTTRLAVRAAGGAAVGMLALGLAACGDQASPTASTVTETVTASPTETPVPTETATETVTAPPATTQPPATPTAGTSPLPEGAAPYADGLVIAWGQGNRAEALRYATPEVVSTLFGEHSPGGDHWDQVATEGAAGTVFVTYQDTVTKQKVVIGVLNEASSKGTEHAADKAKFEG